MICLTVSSSEKYLKSRFYRRWLKFSLPSNRKTNIPLLQNIIPFCLTSYNFLSFLFGFRDLHEKIHLGGTRRADLVCEVTEILDMPITDIMALIMIELLNYDPDLEIKERKLQRFYCQDNVPEHVLANENK